MSVLNWQLEAIKNQFSGPQIAPNPHFGHHWQAAYQYLIWHVRKGSDLSLRLDGARCQSDCRRG